MVRWRPKPRPPILTRVSLAQKMSWAGRVGQVGGDRVDWRILGAWLIAAAIAVSIYFLPVASLLEAIGE